MNLKKIPPFSFVVWLYRLLKLPSRFHELNDSFWQLYARSEQIESKLNETLAQLQNCQSQTAFLRTDLEMLCKTLREMAGLPQSQIVKEIAQKELSSETYLYFAFENQFRGFRDDIYKKQLQYLPFIEMAQKESNGEYLLDLGCGRGEFLMLMREENIPARGVDITKAMIDACMENHLTAVHDDCLHYLKSVRDQSLLGITAFQLVEHLPVEYLIDLIQTSASKISLGGIIILETVNPESFTSLKNFYLDLTHRNPIPPATLKFLVEQAGFKKVEILYTSPIPNNIKLQGSDENTRKLNEMLFGPQDYAVIGRR